MKQASGFFGCAQTMATAISAVLLGLPAAALAARAPAPHPSLSDIVQSKSIDSLILSPDGKKIAFRVLEPSLEQNLVLFRWYSVPVNGSEPATPLGGAMEPVWLPVYDLAQAGVGQWSEDGRYLFVLAQQSSQVQVYRIGSRGSSKQITRDPADIIDFKVVQGGRWLDYRTGNTRAHLSKEQGEAELNGIKMDRTVPAEGLRLTRSYRIGEREVTVRRESPARIGVAFLGQPQTKRVRLRRSPPAPMIPNVASFQQIGGVGPDGSDQSIALPERGGNVFLQSLDPPDPVLGQRYGRYRVAVRYENGDIRPCPAEFCSGDASAIRQVLYRTAGDELFILHEKDYSGRTGLFSWNPHTGSVRTLVDPTGSLDGGTGDGISTSSGPSSGCLPSGTAIICVQAGPTLPPRLVSIDLRSGDVTTLADPNPELARMEFARGRFLEWRDQQNRPANGILFLPPSRGTPPPLVLTTYRCRGFLKGGTGFLAPEQILVQRGMAVLCVNNNNGTQRERDKKGQVIPLAQHKAAVDSYRTVIDLLAGNGTVDRSRVGIAGHSYSSMVTAYAISHSDLFAAAVMGTWSTIDPLAYYLTAPTADSWRKLTFDVMGLPSPTSDPAGIWRDVAPSLNADKIKTPLLMQLPESDGWLPTMELFTRLEDLQKPVEMWIYPFGGHSGGKSPCQQYLRGERSAEWFSRWLLKKTDGDRVMVCPRGVTGQRG